MKGKAKKEFTIDDLRVAFNAGYDYRSASKGLSFRERYQQVVKAARKRRAKK
jgi:hypothetical protein